MSPLYGLDESLIFVMNVLSTLDILMYFYLLVASPLTAFLQLQLKAFSLQINER